MIHLSTTTLTLLCLAAVLHSGYSLQCYNCVTRGGDKLCNDMSDQGRVPVATCGKTASEMFVPSCIKKVIEDKQSKVINTTRACIITKKDGQMDECKASSDRDNVVSCDVCTEDLCNAAATNKMAFMLAPLLFVFITKFFY